MESAIIYMLGSFSINSGGRTKATFIRAAMLQGFTNRTLIATFNFRRDYDVIYASWANRHHLNASSSLANFYEALANEPLYRPIGNRRAFQPPADSVEVRSGRVWKRSRPEGGSELFRLRPDGTIARRDVHHKGTLVMVENYSREGQLRTRSNTTTKGESTTEYFANGPRHFATVRVDATGKHFINVMDGPYFTEGKFRRDETLHKAWVADLHTTYADPLFMIEHRQYDPVVLDNPEIVEGARAIAIIHSTHLLPPFEDVNSIRPYNGKSLLRTQDFSATVLLTEQQRRDVDRHFETKRVTVIPHPVEVGPVRFPLRKKNKRVVVATRLISLKRIDHMIRAFAKVNEFHPTAELHLWGEGASRSELEALAQSLGLGDTVMFHGYTPDPASALRTGEISLSTSETEGFGLSAQESLATGLPVISYDYRYGPRDLIRDGETGRIVKNGDVDSLASAIIDALDHPWRTRVWGMRARRSQYAHRSDAIVEKWRALVGDSSSPRSETSGHSS